MYIIIHAILAINMCISSILSSFVYNIMHKVCLYLCVTIFICLYCRFSTNLEVQEGILFPFFQKVSNCYLQKSNPSYFLLHLLRLDAPNLFSSQVTGTCCSSVIPDHDSFRNLIKEFIAKCEPITCKEFFKDLLVSYINNEYQGDTHTFL